MAEERDLPTGCCSKHTVYNCWMCFNLTRHIKSDHTSEKIKCEHCESSFKRKGDLAKHKRMKHTLRKCEECPFITYEECGLANHKRMKHTLRKCEECPFITYEKCGLVNHMLEKHSPVNYNGKTRKDFVKRIFKVNSLKSPVDVLRDYEGEIEKILKKLLKEKSICAHIIMKVRKRRYWNGEEIEMEQRFMGRGVVIRCNDEIGGVCVKWRRNIMMDYEPFKYPSPWKIERVVNLQLYTLI